MAIFTIPHRSMTAAVLLVLLSAAAHGATPATGALAPSSLWRGFIRVGWTAKNTSYGEFEQEDCVAEYDTIHSKALLDYSYLYRSSSFRQEIPRKTYSVRFNPQLTVTFDRPYHAMVSYSPAVISAQGKQGKTTMAPWVKEVFCPPRVISVQVSVDPVLRRPQGGQCTTIPDWPPCTLTWTSPAAASTVSGYVVNFDGSERVDSTFGRSGGGTGVLITAIAMYAPCDKVPTAVFLKCPSKK